MTRKPKTTEQALKQQAEDAERDRQQALTTFATAMPATLATDTRSSRERYLDEIAPSGVVGRLIKFSKEGQFVFADDDSVVGADEDFVAVCDQTVVAYVKFHEDAPPERIGGLLYNGFNLPPRETLGDVNPTKWPIGLSGQPEDPWRHEILLVLKRPATLELVTFATTSKTGRRAVGALLRHYDRLGDAYPTVRLRPGGFNHRDTRIGWVPTPNFAIVGQAPKATAAVPDTSVSTQLDDAIPFS
jgi:hypothetical protein